MPIAAPSSGPYPAPGERRRRVSPTTAMGRPYVAVRKATVQDWQIYPNGDSPNMRGLRACTHKNRHAVRILNVWDQAGIGSADLLSVHGTAGIRITSKQGLRHWSGLGGRTGQCEIDRCMDPAGSAEQRPPVHVPVGSRPCAGSALHDRC